MRRSMCALGLSCWLGWVQAEAPPAVVSESEMHPGLWEVSVTREVAGSPYRRTVSTRDCHSPSANRALLSVIPKTQEESASCDYSDAKMDGHELSWRVACKGKGMSLTGAGRLTFSGAAFEGSATLERKAGGKVSQLTERLEGKRLEACQ
jgi:Protein of unknown function (DUF3617)